jgi:hypothetical protein
VRKKRSSYIDLNGATYFLSRMDLGRLTESERRFPELGRLWPGNKNDDVFVDANSPPSRPPDGGNDATIVLLEELIGQGNWVCRRFMTFAGGS